MLYILKILDEESRVVSIANDLLEKWNSLKEVFRIPKKVLSVSCIFLILFEGSSVG